MFSEFKTRKNETICPEPKLRKSFKFLGVLFITVSIISQWWRWQWVNPENNNIKETIFLLLKATPNPISASETSKAEMKPWWINVFWQVSQTYGNFHILHIQEQKPKTLTMEVQNSTGVSRNAQASERLWPQWGGRRSP